MQWKGEEYARETERSVGQRVQAAVIFLQTRIRQNISIAGTGIAGSSFVGTAVIGVSGKRYRKGRRIYGSAPSAPGEYPRKQFGTLRQSIATDYDPATVTARIGTNLAYGRWLEMGTRKMAARPFLRRTLGVEQEKIKDMILGAHAQPPVDT